MSYELYEYLHKLHHLVSSQQKRIAQLEKKLLSMKEDLVNLKERPPIQVDKIEYKFDQLKVETLEGTLNIGLNPNDLQEMDEFKVGEQTIQTPPFVDPKNQVFLRELEHSLYHYCEVEVPAIIDEQQKELKLSLDESYFTFIKEDIRKQIPSRIQHYWNQTKTEERSEQHLPTLKGQIFTSIQHDIHQAIRSFISNLPNADKGGIMNESKRSQS